MMNHQPQSLRNSARASQTQHIIELHVVLYRGHDLRTRDHPPLAAALRGAGKRGDGVCSSYVVPAFVRGSPAAEARSTGFAPRPRCAELFQAVALGRLRETLRRPPYSTDLVCLFAADGQRNLHGGEGEAGSARAQQRTDGSLARAHAEALQNFLGRLSELWHEGDLHGSGIFEPARDDAAGTTQHKERSPAETAVHFQVTVYASWRFEPALRQEDRRFREELLRQQACAADMNKGIVSRAAVLVRHRIVDVKFFNSSLLRDPEQIPLDLGASEKGAWRGHWGTLMPFLTLCRQKFGQPPRPSGRPDVAACGRVAHRVFLRSEGLASLSTLRVPEDVVMERSSEERKLVQPTRLKTMSRSNSPSVTGDGTSSMVIPPIVTTETDDCDDDEVLFQSLPPWMRKLVKSWSQPEYGLGKLPMDEEEAYEVMRLFVFGANSTASGRDASRPEDEHHPRKAEGRPPVVAPSASVKNAFGGLANYEAMRSRIDIELGSSRLSAAFRHGLLSPNALYWLVEDAKHLSREQKKTFARRLIWRDLAYFQLRAFPQMHDVGIRPHYDQTEWERPEPGARRSYEFGKTGFPLVDAGMRELQRTGWMQQNVRMVCASFLTEYLGWDWRVGHRIFHDCLVDADLAINAMMWQNAGRSGIDQWNFVLNPCEGKSRDPAGVYVRRWCPELRSVAKARLFDPHQVAATTKGDTGAKDSAGRTWARGGGNTRGSRGKQENQRYSRGPFSAEVDSEGPATARQGLESVSVSMEEVAGSSGGGAAGPAARDGYPCPIIRDLPAARDRVRRRVLAVRRKNLQNNDEGGYDRILLPTGARTRVFTRKEFRINGTCVSAEFQPGPRNTEGTETDKVVTAVSLMRLAASEPAKGTNGGGNRGAAAASSSETATAASKRRRWQKS
ncbi:unnamed protein product [Amoebophrya sp. A120]|nr:unnamed protein product [Amoebophrya sp. A120]|eukprot:GSA120T00017511001.1